MASPAVKAAPAKPPVSAAAPNLLNLPTHLVVPRLTGEVTYRLLNAGVKTRFADKPTSPSAFSFPADCECIDPKTGLAINVRLVGRKQRLPDGKGFYEPTVELEFDRLGYLRLTAKEQAEYEFLERCSLNAGNPYRDPSKGAYFERVDLVAKAKKQEEIDDQVDEARIALRNMKADERARLAAALGLAQLTDEISVITQALRAYIVQKPAEFLENVESPTLACKANVLQAIDEKVIRFDENKRVMCWTGTNGELVNVPTGVDAIDHLVAFLLGDEKRGALVYTELQKRLDRINNG